MVFGEDNAHGTSRVTIVGPPTGLDTLIVPSKADSRRITPRIPVPAPGRRRRGRRPRRPRSGPVGRGSSVDPGVFGAGVLADVGEALGDREVDGRLDRGRRTPAQSRRHRTGIAMSSASA